jgi:hypothetical protein
MMFSEKIMMFLGKHQEVFLKRSRSFCARDGYASISNIKALSHWHAVKLITEN